MRLSVQLYTLRDALAEDPAGTLAKVKGFGLEYVELAGLYGKTPEEWRQMLSDTGLKVSGAHIGLAQLEGEFEKTLDECKTIGFYTAILPWIGESDYSEGWAAFAKRVEPIGQKLKEQGIRFAYHNHAFEFENDGLDTFYATASDVVLAELDLAWVKIGGQDPAAYLSKMAGRVPLVHLKDFDPSQTPQWRPAGEGTMDFDAILAACQTAGVEFGCIELDESPGSPLDAVQKSVEFFHSKGLN